MAHWRRAFGLAVVLALGQAAPGLARSLPDKPPLPIYDPNAMPAAAQGLMSAARKAQADDCRGALDILNGMRGTAGFSALNHDMLTAAYDLGTSCALQREQTDLAYSYALDGTRLTNPSALALRVVIWHAMDQHQPASAVPLIEALAALHKDDFNETPIGWLIQIDRDLAKAHAASDQARLYAVVIDGGYAPTQAGVTPDYFRLRYAAVLAVAGDTAKAAAVFAQIEDGKEQIRASLDPRLHGVVPAGFDARAAVEKNLAALQKSAADHPGSLQTVLNIARHLRWLGRVEDAVALLERNRPDVPQSARFTDLQDQTIWWWNQLADAYRDLGRYNDAVAALQTGAQGREHGGVNVSQTLNLAEMQMTYGHDADALKTLAAFTPGPANTSPYGMMVFTFDRGCARFRTGDLAGAAADRAYAVAHEADLPGNTELLLACMGDLDGAAAVLIRRLNDPGEQVDALLELSEFDAPPVSNPADPFDARLLQIKARPDVAAAIARAGGTRRFHLQRTIS
jgi:tetratricopeptide (TPR) repeat protein